MSVGSQLASQLNSYQNREKNLEKASSKTEEQKALYNFFRDFYKEDVQNLLTNIVDSYEKSLVEAATNTAQNHHSLCEAVSIEGWAAADFKKFSPSSLKDDLHILDENSRLAEAEDAIESLIKETYDEETATALVTDLKVEKFHSKDETSVVTKVVLSHDNLIPENHEEVAIPALRAKEDELEIHLHREQECEDLVAYWISVGY